jgi:hypothetical protein
LLREAKSFKLVPFDDDEPFFLCGREDDSVEEKGRLNPFFLEMIEFIFLFAASRLSLLR